jgi:cytochrome c
MENIMAIYNWFVAHMAEITTLVAYVIATASVVVKLTPTLKDDDALKGVIKFVGKYIALNK